MRKRFKELKDRIKEASDDGSDVDDGSGAETTGPRLKHAEPEFEKEDYPAPNAYPIQNYPEDPNEDPMDTMSKIAKEEDEPDRLDRLTYGKAAIESLNKDFGRFLMS